MADIKISDLQETTSLSNFYVPGSKEESGNLSTKKFDLSGFQSDMDLLNNSIKTNIENFNSEQTYLVGDYIIYDGSVWKFLDIHQGPWTGTDATQVSVYSELESMNNTQAEVVHVNVSKSGGSLDISTVVVTIIITGGNTIQKTCDSSGNCVFSGGDAIPVGSEYTIIMPDKTGYQHIGDATYTAKVPDRYIYVVYNTDLSTETCTVDVNFSVYNGGSINDLNGLSCSIARTTDTSTPIQIQTITNGVATFTNVVKGVSYITGIPTNSLYVTPANKTFYATDNSGIDFAYKYKTSVGIFLVYTVTSGGVVEYREIDLNDLYDNSDQWKGEDGEGNTIDINNAIAFHVNPQTLADNGFDYFVKVADLTSNRTTSYCSWATSNVNFPDIPIATDSTVVSNYYNGPLYTYYMMYDARIALDPTISSPAAEFAITQTLEYKGRTLHGYIGTISQMDYLFTIRHSNNKNLIYKVIGSLYYPSANPADYASTGLNFWSSVQYGSANAYQFRWGNVDGGNPRKISNGSIIPFFAI